MKYPNRIASYCYDVSDVTYDVYVMHINGTNYILTDIDEEHLILIYMICSALNIDVVDFDRSTKRSVMNWMSTNGGYVTSWNELTKQVGEL